MKTLSILVLNIMICTLFFSCQKTFEPGNNLISAGSLVKDASGNCSPITVNGIYKVNNPLNAMHYIDVSVNVTSTGSYEIGTDTLNGIHFGDSAQFSATGVQIVRLHGYGNPVNAGPFPFTVRYNNSSSCAVTITVSPAGSPAAIFTLTGAPGACTAPLIQGTYTAGTILNPSNKIIIAVNVTGLGDYNLTTGIVNGISFSATGTFNTTGNQTVTLSGTGTPLSSGTNSMSISGTATSCSFPLTVGTITSTGTFLAAAYLFDTTLAAPFDTIGRYFITYDVQKRVSKITEFDTKPNGDSSYYSIQTFAYNGTDTVASQSTEYYREFSSVPVFVGGGTHYYNFVNGRCVYDSFAAFTPGNYHAETYVYVGSTILKTTRSLGGSTLSYGNSTIFQTFVNGNNTYQLDTSVSYINILIPGSYHYQREELITTYMPNPNPFYQVKKQILRPYYYDDIGITSAAAPKNLITQQNENMKIWNGANPPVVVSQDQVNYVYTFRPDGYPTEARHTIVSNGGPPAKGKMIFIYQ